MNTQQLGDTSEAMVIAALIKHGKNVLTPIRDKNKYDLVLEDNGNFERIQVKTARKHGEIITFRLCCSTSKEGKRISIDYHGSIDSFMAYCPDNEKIYKVPISLCGSALFSMRLSDAKNKQKDGIHYAKDFEFAS